MSKYTNKCVKKQTVLKKSTVLLVVAVVTNISYDVDPDDKFNKTSD